MNTELPTPLPTGQPDSTDELPRRRGGLVLFLRGLCCASAILAAVGAVVTRDSQGLPLRVDSTQSQALDYVTRIEVVSAQIMDNDTAMRAVLSNHTQQLKSEPVSRSLTAIQQLLQVTVEELGKLRTDKAVPEPFRGSHERLLEASTLLGQHYTALHRAIAATNSQDQQQALAAAQALDTQYARALMTYLAAYQSGLRTAGFTRAKETR
ncbi:hypothetical protein JOF53_006535 [Crossiella equi]|uniref:Methyl-accepting chemotaxis protein n=1 Tax=Crossiella equi TaxID=130796 RepID=A0ABS5AM71_9PSEU|nr:hypothetical protein [Crossiella equi]MBP2477663.1 hypothetical protein [Crossiella equi]